MNAAKWITHSYMGKDSEWWGKVDKVRKTRRSNEKLKQRKIILLKEEKKEANKREGPKQEMLYRNQQ